jgi:hypothetical protein
MIWNGETSTQRETRLQTWQTYYALVPHQMETGEWVWRTHYESRLVIGFNKRYWINRIAGSDYVHPSTKVIGRPPSPQPTNPVDVIEELVDVPFVSTRHQKKSRIK